MCRFFNVKFRASTPDRLIGDPVGKQGKGVRKFQEMLKRAGIKQVDLKLYAEGRHEMINDTNRTEVYGDILKWLQARF